MDTETGTFLVPVTGLYSFTFSALSEIVHPYTWIGVYKNDEVQFWIIDENRNGRNHFDNISHSWMMSLVQNDRVHLKMRDLFNGLAVQPNYFVWFNGQLLKAQ